jgi:hypothetical protein
MEWWSRGVFDSLASGLLAGRNLGWETPLHFRDPPNSGAASPEAFGPSSDSNQGRPMGKIKCFLLGPRRRQPQSSFFNQHFGGWSWGGSFRNGGKRSGSNAGNRTTKKSAPYIVQTCASSGKRCIWRADIRQESDQRFALVQRVAERAEGERRNGCISDENEERSETVGGAGIRRNAGG